MLTIGLAGGSGNGAAVLIGLNRLWELHLNTRQLCKIGEALGSDVPFCVLVQNSRYKAALATGRGEVLEPLKIPMKKHIVLAKPTFGVSTKEVFRGIDRYEILQRPDNRELIHGLTIGDDELVYKLLASFTHIRWDTQYIADNLYHYTFTLYY